MKEEAVYFRQSLSLPGNFVLPSRAVLAPMEGLMSREVFFQSVLTMKLIDSWIPPFIGVSKGAAPKRGALRRSCSRFLESGIPFTLQLLGNDPESLTQACRTASNLGIRSVNLNCGCPSRTVLSSSSGGALLKTPERICEILRMIRREVPEICVSVKLRTGFESPDEFPELASALREGGAQWVILHYRTVREGYLPLPLECRLKRLADARDLLGTLPFFANGDILTPEDAFLYRKECGCDGVAAARGLMKDPFLLRKICGDVIPDDTRAEFLQHLTADLHPRQRKHFYMECVKMIYGEDSAEFRNALAGQFKV